MAPLASDPNTQFFNDQILRLASSYNIPITLFKPTDAPTLARHGWGNFATYAAYHTAAISALSLILYAAIQGFPAASYRRAGLGLAGFAGFIYWPIWLGQTGIPSLDFGVPALGFLATLHVVDIFFVRPPAEVQAWGLLRFIAQLLAFPDEAEDSNMLRMFRNLPWLGIKVLVANILLYMVPSPEVYGALKSPLPYFGYSMFAGIIVMLLLAITTDATLLLIGIATGTEQLPLFNNPLGSSTSIRDFWGRWNLAVKASLGRAVFKVLQSDLQAPVSKRLRRDLADASPYLPGLSSRGKKRYADQLDMTETEAEAESAPTSTATSPYVSEDESKVSASRNTGLRNRPQSSRNGGLVMTPAKAPNRSGTNGKEVKAGITKRDGRRRTGQATKVIAALATFFVSGVYHEQMLWAAFGRKYATGENLTFFMLHGTVMCASVIGSRAFPKLVVKSDWFGWLFVQVFLQLTTPLFVGPFLRYGFFEHLKAASLFNGGQPVAGFVWIFGA